MGGEGSAKEAKNEGEKQRGRERGVRRLPLPSPATTQPLAPAAATARAGRQRWAPGAACPVTHLLPAFPQQRLNTVALGLFSELNAGVITDGRSLLRVNRCVRMSA